MTESCFVNFVFTPEQVLKNLQNARRDLDISRRDAFLEVKFSYAYNALLKAGIALLSGNNLKVRSVPGHHARIIEKLAELLGDTAVEDLGNVMRTRRNADLYAGGTDVTEKDCGEYLVFVESVVVRVGEKLKS